MYFDDIYHPSNIDENFHTSEMKYMEEMKSYDKGYNKMYKKSSKINKHGKFVKDKIEFYTTNISPGAFIRDAETGEKYSTKVGSKDEYNFFKICITTGECKSKNGSNTLFYLSPQHCESHLQMYIRDDLKEKWDELHL